MIAIDERHWPLVVFRFVGEVTMEELDAYLARQDEMMARNQKTASLVIAENVKMWEARVVRRQAEWMKRNHDVLREHAVGVALVMSSPLVRGMLRAILWMQPMPQPHLVCTTVAEALIWLRKRCQEANVRIAVPLSI